MSITGEPKHWNLLLKDHCPKCKLPLVRASHGKGFECSGSGAIGGTYCDFFITNERLEQLKKNQRNARARRKH